MSVIYCILGKKYYWMNSMIQFYGMYVIIIQWLKYFQDMLKMCAKLNQNINKPLSEEAAKRKAICKKVCSEKRVFQNILEEVFHCRMMTVMLESRNNTIVLHKKYSIPELVVLYENRQCINLYYYCYRYLLFGKQEKIELQKLRKPIKRYMQPCMQLFFLVTSGFTDQGLK